MLLTLRVDSMTWSTKPPVTLAGRGKSREHTNEGQDVGF